MVLYLTYDPSDMCGCCLPHGRDSVFEYILPDQGRNRVHHRRYSAETTKQGIVTIQALSHL